MRERLVGPALIKWVVRERGRGESGGVLEEEGMMGWALVSV